MKKIEVVITSLAMVFLAASAVCAGEQGRFHRRWQENKDGIFRELNLSPEQKNKLAENRKSQGEESARLRSAIKDKHSQLQQKLNDPAVTREAIEPLVSELKALDARQVDNRINGIFAVKAILTPEQFTKFNQLMEEKMRERKGKDRSRDSRQKPESRPPGM